MTFMSCVCVCSGVVNPAGSLIYAPMAPLAWLPHRSATFTPGAPAGSRSVHLRAPAGVKTGGRAPPFCAAFAPDDCARRGAVRINDIENARTFLDLIAYLLCRYTLSVKSYYRRPFSSA